MADKIDFFQCLETALEPVFSTADYAQIPQDLRSKLESHKLFEDTYLTEVECGKCGEDCPENNCLFIKHSKEASKYFYTCPTGYLKNPAWLTDDAVRGKQFDFNRLAELICTKSNLSPGGNETDNFLRPIALDQINAQSITVIYGYGLSMEKNFISRILETFSIYKAEEIFIIVPSNDALQISGINALKHIHLITLKDVLRKDFNISGIIKQKPGEIDPSKNTPAHLSVPHGTTWEEIKVIVEQDEERCDIFVNEDRHSYKYNNPKLNGAFVNKRDKKPNKQWKLLVAFAKGNGKLGWGKGKHAKQTTLSKDSPDALDSADYSGEAAKFQIQHPRDQQTINKFKTHIKLLRKILQDIFGIETNPISYSKPDKMYRTYFEISYRIDIPHR